MVVLLLYFPTDPNCTDKEDSHNKDVFVLAIPDLFDDLFFPEFEALGEFLLPWLKESLQEIGLWLATMEDLKSLFLFFFGGLFI